MKIGDFVLYDEFVPDGRKPVWSPSQIFQILFIQKNPPQEGTHYINPVGVKGSGDWVQAKRLTVIRVPSNVMAHAGDFV